ncbi:unnamed protein product [Rotaria sp. Silwood1]|nr:unnamed protein product [Rotaria sp. Silwood1]
MMHRQERSHLSSESASSETSSITSRATTLTGAFSDNKSNTSLEYQPVISGLDRLKIYRVEDDHSSAFSSTAPSASTVINMKPNTNRIDNNQSNEMITQNQQKPWINPYWGSNWKPNTTATRSEANKINTNTNVPYSSAPGHISQLIPGSILINDQGELDDLSWNKNTHIRPLFSNNPLNPSGKYIPDDNRGPGGYLAPTHVQRRIVISSPGIFVNPEINFGYTRSSSSSDLNTHSRPTFNRQQTFPESTDNNIQQWVNPYWGTKPNQTKPQVPQYNNRLGNQQSVPSSNSTQGSWVNPYWGTKPNQTKPQVPQYNNRLGNQQSVPSSNSTQSSWVNPYWGTKPNQTKPQVPQYNNRLGNQKSVPPSNSKQSSWVNPYWDTKPNQTKPQVPQYNNRLGNQQSVPPSNSKQGSWVNPYWGTKPNQTKPQVPQYNNRLGNQQSVPPSNSKQSSWVNPYWGPKPSEKSTLSPEIRKLPISTMPKQNNSRFQNPYWKDKNAFDQNTDATELNKSLSCEFSAVPVPSFYKRIYPPDETFSSSMSTANMRHNEILSENIDDNEDMPFTIDSQGIVHYRAEPSSPTIMNQTANIPSSSTTLQYPVVPPTTNTHVLPSTTPNIAPISQVTNSISHSYPENMTSPQLMNSSNDPSSSFNDYASLTSSSAVVLTEADLESIQHALYLLETSPNVTSVIGNSQQTPLSTISHSNDPSSSLASLFTGNKEQPSQPRPPSFSANIQHNLPSYPYNSNSQQSPLFSTPSYPSNSNDILDLLSMINNQYYEKQAFLDHSNGHCLSSSSDNETMSRYLKIQRNFKRFYITTKLRSSWIRILLYLLLFIIYSIFIINFYEYFFVQPDFSSKLLSSSYACHDTPSCTIKNGLLIRNEKVIQNKNYSRNAFFSALYTDNYLLGALILGYTIQIYHPNHPMYMLYFQDRLYNETTLCALQIIGWKLMNVKRIPSVPGTNKKYVDQFTKLILWNMTQFDSIVYLDCDTVVLNDLSHLHELVMEPKRTGFEFAAATDNWFGTYIYKFNAGVLVLHPSQIVFNELMRTYIIPGNYRTVMAEQEFLNQFFRLRYLQLPTVYNMNMAVYSSKQYLWETLRPDFKIVHFTIRKPFMSDGKSTRGYKGVYDLYDEVYTDFLKNPKVSLLRTSCYLIL